MKPAARAAAGLAETFLWNRTYSLTEDLCVAAMMNRYGMAGIKMGNKLNEAGNLIFENAKKIKANLRSDDMKCELLTEQALLR